MTIHRSLMAVAVLVLCGVAYVAAADVTGKWTATFDTQAGQQEYTYDFVVKGSTLTGTAKGNLLGESEIQDGKVEGDTITFVENAKFQDMELRVEYTGTMTSADEIKFTRKVGDLATENLVATRAK